MDLQGRRVTIVGLAREGTALARYLAGRGAKVMVTDIRDERDLAESVSALRGFNHAIVYRLGGHSPDVLDAEVLFVSPGVPGDAPVLRAARRRRIPIRSATSLFLEECRAPVIGITGSSGKTTVTTLVGRMLEQSGLRVWVGGNIGRPLLEHLDQIGPSDLVVLELSSFQLETAGRSPVIAAVLNLTPDHLDRHPSFDAYRAAKANILRYQSPDDVALLNYDDAKVRRLGRLSPAKRVHFSLVDRPVPGAYLDAGMLVLQVAEGREPLVPSESLKLRGRHNIANMLAAAALARLGGATMQAIRDVASTFTGVAHRLEVVRELAGVQFVNDSIGTAPDRSMAAMRAFHQPIVLLAGGVLKAVPLEDWANVAAEHARCVVLFGRDAPYLDEALRAASVRVERCSDLAEAVRAAVRVAKAGDVVLLSPACASFDTYADYEQRGEHFRRLVSELDASPEERNAR